MLQPDALVVFRSKVNFTFALKMTAASQIIGKRCFTELDFFLGLGRVEMQSSGVCCGLMKTPKVL